MSERLKFCMVTTFYPPYHFGGDAIAVQRLARGLVEAGHDVTVVHSIDAYRVLGGNETNASQAADGVKVVALSSGAPLLATLLAQQLGRPVFHRTQLAELLNGDAFDVVHFHNASLMGAPEILRFGGNAARLYTAHEHWLVCPTHVLWRRGRELCTARECFRCVMHYRRPPQLWRNTDALEKAAAQIDTFIALSEFSRDMHRQFGFASPMEVLPPCVPDDGVVANAPRPHARPYFLFAGRLEQIKGLDDVLPEFFGSGEADLLIAGDGDHRSALEAFARGHERIHFLGRMQSEALGAYYQHAQALVVPSVCYETFGITVIEAFQRGTPVIARNLGPFPEIMQQSQGGVLFHDDASLRASIASFLGDGEQRRTFAARARAAFVSRWSTRAVLPKYLELVSEARARRRLRATST